MTRLESRFLFGCGIATVALIIQGICELLR